MVILVSFPCWRKGEEGLEEEELDSLDNDECPEFDGEMGCPSVLEEEDRATGEEAMTPLPAAATSGKSLSPGIDCRKDGCLASELALDLFVNSCNCAGSCFCASR